MSGRARRAPGWACTVCGRSTRAFAPSGRCVGCEAAVDCPTARDAGSLRQIGEVAALVGLSLRTVRHYEDAGLVLPTARTPGGFRLYDDDAVARLRLIMQMKPLGFTLEEMRVLIEVRSRLAKAEPTGPDAAALREQLVMFSEAAAERVAQLRGELEIAEAFAAALRSEVERRSV